MNKILFHDQPSVMGVINLTPDSFYKDSRTLELDSVIEKVSYMVDNQVDILDIGGMSSRPGARIIDAEEEIERLMPSFNLIRKAYPDLFISIDTVHGKVAETFLDLGANMINDISAGAIDNSVLLMANKYSAYYCLMHMQNRPENMQNQPTYQDVVLDVLTFLKNKVVELQRLGMEKIIIDPGFGFGKSTEDNYQLLKELEVFNILELPLLIGISRKSMVYKPLNISSEESLPASTALHLLALQKGVKILRVHDVREAKQAIKLYEILNN